MNIAFAKLNDKHRSAVIGILNHYILHSTAAYRAETVTEDFFANLIEGVVSAYAMLDQMENVIGFCMLEKYKNISTFTGLGDCMYFIQPEMTGKGIGEKALALLEQDAIRHGMKKLVVDICDENSQSLAFHLKHGFVEYGRLSNCWHKFGRDVGIVYLVKDLQSAPAHLAS